MKRMASLLWLLSALACEHGITLSGSVQVAASLTDEFIDTQPGVVVVSASVPKSSVPSYRLAVLCEPSQDDVQFTWLHDGFGCAKEGTVTARLFSVDAAAVDAACGAASVVGGAPASAMLLSETSATIFAGETETAGCSDGADKVVLRLEP